MNHYATPDFRRSYRKLPPETQRTADKNFRLLAENPHHPSLHFKKIGGDLWSVRIGRRYRALATMEGDDYVWFWIGTHAEYDKLV